jgi:hypothetical protein
MVNKLAKWIRGISVSELNIYWARTRQYFSTKIFIRRQNATSTKGGGGLTTVFHVWDLKFTNENIHGMQMYKVYGMHEKSNLEL